MKELASACSTKNIEEILAMPDVMEREKVYFEQEVLFKEMITKHAHVDGNVIVVDLRGVETIHAGNRFLMYTLYPEQNISVWIVDGRGKQNCAITVGYSITNRSATVNVGSMLLKHGGGGHTQVGTCQVPYEEADKVIADIIAQCKSAAPGTNYT
jgi:nanoRNase/pAp phosphatase (c-di-AMP/oligoRNAs hydrolase)